MLDKTSRGYQEYLKSYDAVIEWGQFQMASARWGVFRVLPYFKVMAAHVGKKLAVDHMVMERSSLAYSDPALAERVIYASGFASYGDVVRWVDSGRRVYAAWQKAKAAGDFSLLVPEADRRYELARLIGTRRMELFNRLASGQGVQPIHKISESFIQSETPGLDTFKVDSMSEDVAFWAPKTRAYIKHWQEGAIRIPREAVAAITPEDKMVLARRLLDFDPDGLSHVVLKPVQRPLCQGYGKKIGVGLNPDQSFFAFLKAYRHERAHAAYRLQVKGSPPGSALDEMIPLMEEHFIPPDAAECRAVIDHLREIMGARFPSDLTSDHIRQGMLSLLDEDIAPGEADFFLYAIQQAIYSRTEARMLDEALPMKTFPDILAEHVWMFTGQTLSRADAEKMALERFQPFFSLGRGKAYEAAIYAAATLSEKLKPLTAWQRREWLRENLYTLEGTPRFMEAVKHLTGAPLSARGLENATLG